MEEKLIEMVRQNPFLYDKRSLGYKHMETKGKKWNEIANKLSLNVQDARKRWVTLRDRYHREKKKEQVQASAGSAPSKTHWKYMKLLRFLDDIPKSNSNTKGNYINEEEICESENIIMKTEPETNCDDKTWIEVTAFSLMPDDLLTKEESTVPIMTEETVKCPKANDAPKKERRNRQNQDCSQSINEAHKEMTEVLQLAKQSLTVSQNSTNLFFSSIALQIEESNLPSHSTAYIKSQIMSLVAEEINKYKLDST